MRQGSAGPVKCEVGPCREVKVGLGSSGAQLVGKDRGGKSGGMAWVGWGRGVGRVRDEQTGVVVWGGEAQGERGKSRGPIGVG